MDDLCPRTLQPKISPILLARLSSLGPKQKLRAIVVLNAPRSGSKSPGKRPDKNERQAVIKEMRLRSPRAIKRIDAILERFEGRRLSPSPTAVGTVVIETNPAGIFALSESEFVKAILQDQPVARVV